MYNIKIKRISGYEDIPFPKRMSEYASGFDIYAGVDQTLNVMPGERVLIPAGFSLEMPKGLEAQIRPRSGLAINHGITMLNSPGTIDADYRGHVKVILINLGEQEFTIQRGDRIAQMVFMELPEVKLEEVEKITETVRGTGGFGHTGK